MKVGDKLSWQRTFTEEDVQLFAQLSGDEGEHHLRAGRTGPLDGPWLIDSDVADQDWRRHQSHRA